MARVKSKIEFFENVPIAPDFKHAPLFDTEAEQNTYFNQFRNDNLTFEGSYQRTEEQIRSPHKVEKLLNVNYVKVTNPSYEGASKANSTWWGFVMGCHYRNDELVTVDWVVDPIQTFMFKWDLNSAFIERGMMNLVMGEGETASLDENKVSILTNSEPIGVDGLGYLINGKDLYGEGQQVRFLILVISDAHTLSHVGVLSQVQYYVLPYDPLTGYLYHFRISNVSKGAQKVTIENDVGTGSEQLTLRNAIQKITEDTEFTQGGKAVKASYIQNEIGVDFKLEQINGKTILTAKLNDIDPSDASKYQNMEVISVGKTETDPGGEDPGGGDDGGDDGGDTPSTPTTDYAKVLALMAKYEMGNRNSGYYHEPLNDGAGWNYGKYSFTQAYEMDNFLSWLSANYPTIRSQLTGAVGSSEFNSNWAAVGQADDAKFTEIQAEYFCTQKLKPQIAAVKSSTGVDFNDGTKALGSMSLFCSIINWYPASVSSGKWFNKIIASYASSWNDSSFITETCDFIVANAYDMVAPEYVEGIQNRFRNEKTDSLALTEKVKLEF